MNTPDAYPLSWPVNVPRSRVPRSSPFGKHSIGDARDEVLREIARLGGRRVVISSNLRLRGDGLPISNQSQPRDVGVAVYFRLEEKDLCLPCDRWNKAEHNLWAIAKDIEAQRGRQRWGVGSTAQAFAGYVALVERTEESCWDVLGIGPGSPPERINAAFRELAKRAHPDAGGSDEKMARLNRAREMALAHATQGGGRP